MKYKIGDIIETAFGLVRVEAAEVTMPSGQVIKTQVMRPYKSKTDCTDKTSTK